MKKIFTLLILFTLGFTGYCDQLVADCLFGSSSDITDYYTVETAGEYRIECTVTSFSSTRSTYTYISVCYPLIFNAIAEVSNSHTLPVVYSYTSSFSVGDVFGTNVSHPEYLNSLSYNIKVYKVGTPTENDQDGDGIPDDIDDDDDGDGIPDVNDPDHPDYDPDHPDSDPDGDGIPNDIDDDDDGDGVDDEDDPDSGDEGDDDSEFEFKELSAWETIKEKLSPNTDGSFSSFSPTLSIPVEFEDQSYNIGLDFNNLPHGFASNYSTLKGYVRIFCKIVFSWIFVLSIYKFLNK